MGSEQDMSGETFHAELTTYRQLFEHAQEGVVITQDENIRFANPWFYESIGYSEEELTSLACVDLAEPHDRDILASLLQKVGAGENLSGKDSVRLVGAQDVLSVTVSGTAVQWHGRPAALLFFSEKTPCRETEEALKNTIETTRILRQRFQGMFDHLSIGVAIYEPVDDGDDFTFVDFNKAAERISHVTRQEVLGRRLLECFPNMEKSDLFTALREVFKTGRPQHLLPFYYEDTRRKGWRENRIYRIPSGEVVALFEDVTEQKIAEDALRKALEQITFHVENSPLGVIEWKGGSHVVSWSSRAEKIFGWKGAEVIGKSWNDLKMLVPEEQAEVERQIGQLFSGEKGCNIIHNSNYDKDRNLLHCLWYNSALRDASGKVVSIFSQVEDVTESVRALEKKDLLEEQFYQAQKLESVGRLAGGIAHDLNNLLSPILGYGEMLLQDIVGMDPRKEPLQEIVNAGIRARNLVRQLLAFSRKQTLEVTSVHLDTLLRNFTKLLSRTIREDILMTLDLGENIPCIRGDVGQLEQIVMNLVVNAQDAMPEGGKLRIEVRAVRLDKDFTDSHQGADKGPHVMLKVSDTGCGMTSEISEHIFEPFFTTKEKGKGTGLGLATVYGIVKQHKGSIFVTSHPGEGTAIAMYFPEGQAVASSPEESPSVGSAIQGAGTILLVEDNSQVLELASIVLRREGYRVIIAESGAQALEVVKGWDGPLDLLLSDVVMPEMNGRQVYEHIAALYPEIKVLYMSGYNDDVIADHGVLENDVHFLQKPFTVQSLKLKVREVLTGHVDGRG